MEQLELSFFADFGKTVFETFAKAKYKCTS